MSAKREETSFEQIDDLSELRSLCGQGCPRSV
jgi:hypothetical protein